MNFLDMLLQNPHGLGPSGRSLDPAYDAPVQPGDETWRASMFPLRTVAPDIPGEGDRMEFAVPGIFHDTWEAIKLPGRLLSGEAIPEDEIRRLGSIGAGFAMTGGLVAPRVPNSLASGLRGYHGTTHEISGRMRPSEGARGEAVYFNTSPEAASSYVDGSVGNYFRMAPDGDHPSVLPVDIEGRIFDENALMTAEERRRLAELHNERVAAERAKEGKTPYQDELFDPEEFSSSYFDRAYQPKGYNVLQSLGGDQNEYLKALGYTARMGNAAGMTGGKDIAVFTPGTVKSATTGETLFSNGSREGAGVGMVNALSTDDINEILKKYGF